MNGKTQRLHDILSVFDLTGEVVDITPWRAGHINDTFIAATRKGERTRRYTLQRINAVVFPRPDLIMHNIRVVTEEIRKKSGDAEEGPGLRALTLVETRGGESYHRDDDGAYWRCYHYVEGITYNQVPGDRTGPTVAREAAAQRRTNQGLPCRCSRTSQQAGGAA